MNSASCSAVLGVMLCTGTTLAATQFHLSEPSATLAPGDAFSLQVTLVQSDPNAVKGAVRLKASSSGILIFTGGSIVGPHRDYGIYGHEPLDPYSEFFGLLLQSQIEPPRKVMTLNLQVDPSAQAGSYTLELADVRAFDPDFADLPATGDEVSLEITPEPATIALLALGLCVCRREPRDDFSQHNAINLTGPTSASW